VTRRWWYSGLASVVALPLGIHWSGLVMNYSDSVPTGLYRRVPASVVTYAGFCLPEKTASAAIQAGLEVVPGACPEGLAPILKPLIQASPQHPVAYTERGFWWGGKLLPNTAPKARSRTGATLQHYTFGVYTNGVWAVSDFNANSYDSRYFGPVAPDAIRFYAKPVWTWRKRRSN
jgi:conjugative transfer signal peptidase TraF